MTERIEPQGKLNIDQAQIVEDAGNLLDTLDVCVPSSTVHYAVEETRRALTTLIREAHTVKTAGTEE